MNNNGKTTPEAKGNPYATNKAGYIKAPVNPGASDPKVSRITGKGDHRGGK